MKNAHSSDSPETEDVGSDKTDAPERKPERPRLLTLEERSHSFPQTNKAVLCDESDDGFLDAYVTPQMSSSLELLNAIAECRMAMDLFLNNKFQMAEDHMAAQSKKSMYHAIGYCTIIFIKATMTYDRQDMEKAMRVADDAASIIDTFRAKFSISDLFSKLTGQMRTLTDQELHAELCYAESLLLRAILTFLHDETLISFVQGALKIRACYQSYRECDRLLKSKVWMGRDTRIKEQFESGTRLGVGTFNLMLSTLPARVLRLLEVVGFSGDKEFGLHELRACASMSGTLRATLCSLVLLSWHLIALFFVGAANPDISICKKLLSPLIASYPQWANAANYAKRLLDESRWSKCVYTYTLAVLINADETTSRRIETVEHLLKWNLIAVPQSIPFDEYLKLFNQLVQTHKEEAFRHFQIQKVPDLRMRVAGKSLPHEKFCIHKSNRFLKTGSLLFGHYEFLYFWNGFTIMAANTNLIEPILEDIESTWERLNKENVDIDDTCLYLLLRGVCLRLLRKNLQAEQCFNDLIDREDGLDKCNYMVPYAVFELAQLRADEHKNEDAKQLLEKARAYKGYPMNMLLHFRIHNANEALGARTPLFD